jgi:hypothetical protein
MLKCWQDTPGYRQFVVGTWQSLQVDGWGGYVLKEKLKMLKTILKEWHADHSRNVSSRIVSLKARLADLDGKGEDEGLHEDEISKLHDVTAAIHSLTRMQTRLLWLREGDANSKYYHSVLKSR